MFIYKNTNRNNKNAKKNFILYNMYTFKLLLQKKRNDFQSILFLTSKHIIHFKVNYHCEYSDAKTKRKGNQSQHNYTIIYQPLFSIPNTFVF